MQDPAEHLDEFYQHGYDSRYEPASADVMEYMAYAKSLREAAEFFQKNRPELPDVVATYKKSADVIESLLLR